VRVDFLRYADRAVELANAHLETVSDLRALLADRAFLQPRIAESDLRRLRRLQAELRPVFAASDRGDEREAVVLLNGLLAKYPVSPRIAGDETTSWHLHAASRGSSVAEHLIAEALLGLAVLVVDVGAGRLGECQAVRCDKVFIDTSPNRSRRYCCDRCATRSNVAAYRARLRSASHV
jgi:CGNR zinc finger/Putative stress-induced transcription regulator